MPRTHHVPCKRFHFSLAGKQSDSRSTKRREKKCELVAVSPHARDASAQLNYFSAGQITRPPQYCIHRRAAAAAVFAAATHCLLVPTLPLTIVKRWRIGLIGSTLLGASNADNEQFADTFGAACICYGIKCKRCPILIILHETLTYATPSH